MQFVEFPGEEYVESLIAVDCSHPSARQLTHHLKGSAQRNAMNLSLRGDSSTDAVLNAILSKDDDFKIFKHVTTNHFDIDSFLCVWCAIFSTKAIEHELILREAAKIGDFRELDLGEPFMDQKDVALRLVCWINSIESKMFYEPFESPIARATGERDAMMKFNFFIPNFEAVLLDPMNPKYVVDYEGEYSRVVAEYNALHCLDDSGTVQIQTVKECGLVIVSCPDPLHYYSLFSVSSGLDIVVSCYSQNRYEVELKYTSYVDIFSRGCLPRVDMRPLARFLNRQEKEAAVAQQSNDAARIEWCSDSITDSGPILRRQDLLRKLTKAERYGQPFEREHYPSLIPRDKFISFVISYFRFAYSSGQQDDKLVAPKIDWTWKEIHDFNHSINWATWEAAL